MESRIHIVACFGVACLLAGCGKQKNPSPSPEDSVRIVQDNLTHRAEADDFFRSAPESPFKRPPATAYHGIRWYPIDVHFRVQSVLHRYAAPETVSVYGTKGEERKNLRYGYFEFDVPAEDGGRTTMRVNVYKFTPYDSTRYALYRNNLSVWFTDKTTGKETYGVGRYIELGDENPDPAFVYTIDFNKAFNPYCAYSEAYSCAIPRKEDHLDMLLRVGEMKYHD